MREPPRSWLCQAASGVPLRGKARQRHRGNLSSPRTIEQQHQAQGHDGG